MDDKAKAKYLGDIEYFSAKLEKEPSSILFIPLAKAYIKLDKYDEAVQVLTAGIDANTEYVSAKTMLAWAYLGQGKTDDAKAILTEIQVIDKNNYLASKLMGDILRNEDEIKKALMSYRNALMVAPEDTELRNLVEELMSASGIAASELDRDASLMDADDETLEHLGNELAEEVRNEVGESELGRREASEDEVSKAIDDIVGDRGLTDEDDEMSLDSYQQDYAGDPMDELEEEMVASLDDSIIPMDLSSDDGAVSLGEDVLKEAGDEPAPDEADVQALAAELGAELGLDLGEPPSDDDAPKGKPDAVDDALANLFEGVQEQDVEDAGVDTGLSFFDGVEEAGEEDVIEDDLKALLSGDAEAPAAEAKPEEDIEAMLAMVHGEQAEDEAEPEADEFGALEAFDVESPEKMSEPEDDIEAMLAKMQAEQTEDEAEPEADEFGALEAFDEESPEKAPEPEDDTEAILAKMQAEQAEEDSDDPFAGLVEADDEKPDAEPAEEKPEEIFEASMDELLEAGPEEISEEEEPDTLDAETREQVNRLENLLEIIKNNAGN